MNRNVADSVTRIRVGAFDGCSASSNLQLPKSSGVVEQHSSVIQTKSHMRYVDGEVATPKIWDGCGSELKTSVWV